MIDVLCLRPKVTVSPFVACSPSLSDASVSARRGRGRESNPAALVLEEDTRRDYGSGKGEAKPTSGNMMHDTTARDWTMRALPSPSISHHSVSRHVCQLLSQLLQHVAAHLPVAGASLSLLVVVESVEMTPDGAFIDADLVRRLLQGQPPAVDI